MAEIKVLATVEGIKECNLTNYINMMKDGISSIILLSKWGALAQAHLLVNGCEMGLKLQRTHFLDDLYIEHKADKSVFREKINKEFYNVL